MRIEGILDCDAKTTPIQVLYIEGNATPNTHHKLHKRYNMQQLNYSKSPFRSPSTLLMPPFLPLLTFFLNTSFRFLSLFSSSALRSASRACAWMLLFPVPPRLTLSVGVLAPDPLRESDVADRLEVA